MNARIRNVHTNTITNFDKIKTNIWINSCNIHLPSRFISYHNTTNTQFDSRNWSFCFFILRLTFEKLSTKLFLRITDRIGKNFRKNTHDKNKTKIVCRQLDTNSASDKIVEQVRQSFVNSPTKSTTRASSELQVPHTTMCWENVWIWNLTDWWF